MNQELLYRVVLDSTGAQSELGELDAAAERVAERMSETEGRFRAFAGQATDVRDVVEEVERLERSAKQLNAVLNSPARGQLSPAALAALEQRAAAVNARLAGATGMTGALRKVQPAIQKTSTATAGLASVLGGMGSQAGATYGALSNLANVMLSTGPWGIALVAATTGTAALVKWLDEADKSSTDLSRTLNLRLVKSLRAAEDAAHDAVRELKNFGLTPVQVRIADVEAALQRERRALEEMERAQAESLERRAVDVGQYGDVEKSMLFDRRVAEEGLAGAIVDMTRDRLEQQRSLVEEHEKELAALRALMRKQTEEDGRNQVRQVAEEWKAAAEVFDISGASFLVRAEETLKAEGRRRAAIVERNLADLNDLEEQHRRTAEQREAAHQVAIRDLRLKTVDDFKTELAIARMEQAAAAAELEEALAAARDAASGGLGSEERLAEAKRLLDERVQAEAEAAERILQLQERLEQKRIEVAERTHEKMRELEQRTYEILSSSVESIANNALSASLTLMEGQVKGHRESVELMLADFLSATGQQIALIGLRYAIEGTLRTLAGDPQGPPLAGGGLAALAIGGGMALGGMGLAHVASGGVIGQALPSSVSGGGPSLKGRGGGGGLSTRETPREADGGRSEAHYHFHAPIFDYNGSARAVRELYDHEQHELLGGRGRR